MTKEIENNYSNKLIVKSNSLVEARYKLNLQESRVILWLLSQINSEDNDFKRYYLDIKNFASITELTLDNQYSQLKKITESLTRKSLKIYESDKKTLLQTTWLSAAFYEFSKGYVALEFSPYLKPYLLKIKSHFTAIQAGDLLKLKSVHSIRIFELLKQYEKIGKRTIYLDDLRTYCGVGDNQYRNYNAVKLYIIERAKTEITAKTEYRVDYTEIKESRKVVAIEWRIKKKGVEDEANKQIQILTEELNLNSILIKDIMDYGYGKASARKFIADAGEIVVKNALAAVSNQLKRNQVKNPKAMLRVAIREKWHPERDRNGSKGESFQYSALQHESVADNADYGNHDKAFKLPDDCMPKFKSW